MPTAWNTSKSGSSVSHVPLSAVIPVEVGDGLELAEAEDEAELLAAALLDAGVEGTTVTVTIVVGLLDVHAAVASATHVSQTAVPATLPITRSTVTAMCS
jgi:hypothetical protein